MGSACLGFIALLWHILALILYIVNETDYPTAYLKQEASTFTAVVWFLEIISNLLMLVTSARIAIAPGGFTKLNLDMIDSFEMREFEYLLGQRQIE